MVSADAALAALLKSLKAHDYRFTTVTPATHQRVLDRPFGGPASLRDVFGWNRCFRREDLPAELFEIADEAGIVEEVAGGLRSRLRVASLGNDLFLHSAFPTDSADAVFFGPDTYRFARFVAAQCGGRAPVEIVDMGAGSGAGAIAAARAMPASKLTLVDVNPAALRLAAVNAAAAGVEAEYVQSDRVPAADLVIANPPYMIDLGGRRYRDGGALYGGAVALDWVRQALAALRPGGRMLLYTGAAYVDGRAPLIEAVQSACDAAGAELTVDAIDPDVFGDELDEPAYAAVERIAAIGAVIRTPG
jgi:SAM-dependent methyltransferase